MKRAILVGAGAEIGSNLLLMNNPEKDGFAIEEIVTNPPAVHHKYPHLRPIDGIVARLALAQPGAHKIVKVEDSKTITIRGRRLNINFSDFQDFKISESNKFDIAFLATSKNDISASSLVASLLSKNCGVVLGVAEADDLPSIYACLNDLADPYFLTSKIIKVDGGVYCLGSCQTNGMHASLRVIADVLFDFKLSAKSIIAVETDIVHPDTPNGVLGTKSFEGREQDARNNLRPSFSQISQSQKKVIPWAPLINTISLRVPVHAPGFQINRFIVRDEGLITYDAICDVIHRISRRYKFILQGSDIPLGSRSYAYDRCCSTILTDKNHLLINRPDYLRSQGLSQIILQSFVNNTIGYSSLVISVARSIAMDLPIAIFSGD